MSTLAELLGKAPVSIQSGTISWNSGDNTKNATISPVDTTKSIVLAAPSTYSEYSVAAQLLNSTTVQALSNSFSMNYIGNLSFWVIDFGSMVKGVQRGVMGNGVSAATLSTVNPAKCATLISAGSREEGSQAKYNNQYTLTANQLSMSVAGTFSTNFYWQVVEFY